MPLSRIGNALLRAGNALTMSLQCCCQRYCKVVGVDECGNETKACVTNPAGTLGPCTEDCTTKTPCECGPNKPCPSQCEECVNGECVKIQDCCDEANPCGECQTCIDGVCVACGECQQCVDGICLPCGPCQKCVDGTCFECGAYEVCIGGVCVPKQYYCCYEECPEDPTSENPNPTPPQTNCVPATVTPYGQSSPCGTGSRGYGEDCDLTKSGPYTSLQQCTPNCQKYKCAPDACGNRHCTPDPNGPYTTRQECLNACTEDPCAGSCTFTGATSPGTYSIDACERDICVSYISKNSKPIRVQIWGPSLDANCNIVATRVIKTDSDWRGEECCDCPEVRGAGQLEGGPKGKITWTKPQGVQSFEVAVLNPCDADFEISVRCSDECPDLGEPEMCECAVDEDCNVDAECYCCPDENNVLRCTATRCKCKPCTTCSFPQSRNEAVQVNGQPCGAAFMGSRYQGSFSGPGLNGSLPHGLSWKDGYPAALDGCNWALVVDVVRSRCQFNFPNGDPGCEYAIKYRYKLFSINCDTQSYDDLTGNAIEGELEQVDATEEYQGVAPRCMPEFPEYFDSFLPPVCNNPLP